MIKRIVISCLMIIGNILPGKLSYAQVLGPFQGIFQGMSQNAVTSLGVMGDTVWIGPGLNSKIRGQTQWSKPNGADSLLSASGRVFSLETKKGVIVAGIGKTVETNGETEPSAFGTYISTDGGSSWTFHNFLLDPQPPADCISGSSEVGGCDTLFTYGGQVYSRIRITTPVQSPPYELDVYDQMIVAVHWASGLLRSRNLGQNWERLFLPPSSVSEMVPERTYRWTSQLADGTLIERYDPRFDTNLLGFGVLIDHNQRVWTGTAGGINISDNALTAPSDSVIWKHIRHSGESDGLAGNWIIRIRQHPDDQSIWMTNWPATASGEEYAIVRTDNEGETFTRMLNGIKINDIGFSSDAIYAVGDAIYQSFDKGNTWREIKQISISGDRIPTNTEFYTVGSTPKGLYIGSSQGLLYTENDGESWEIYRTQFPLEGGNQYNTEASSVSSYAYPNPFSPTRHQLVRIRFNGRNIGSFTLRIYDASMNPVNSLQSLISQTGDYEFVWDGRNSMDQQVHNGVYIGVLEGPGLKTSVKIILID